MILRVSALAVAGALLLGACTPTVSYQGFQAVEANPKDVKVGEDTKSTVLARLGSPSSVAAFAPHTWFYVPQLSSQVAFRNPSVRRRDVVVIAFNKDDEKVSAVRTYGLKDGKQIAMNGDSTPTRGRELSWVEQVLGTIGEGSMIPQQDVNPGSQRPR